MTHPLTIASQGPTERIPVPASEGMAVINMIERAARDPAVDIDKLRQLIEMRAQLEATAAARGFDMAMTAAQTELRPIATDCNNPQTKSKYASYFALDRALRPLYTRHGFSLSFNTADCSAEGCIRVCCRVANSGHAREYHIDMPADGKGAKGGDVMTRTHATGAAVSYGMRYLLKMIFNIAVGGDDDGNGASGDQEYVTPQQVAELEKLIKDTGGDVQKFCKFARVEKLTDIFASRFDAAMDAVRRAGEARKAKNA